MQLNVQSSFGRARGLLGHLFRRDLPERLLMPSMGGVSLYSTTISVRALVSKSHARSTPAPVSQPTPAQLRTPCSAARAHQAQRGFTLIELLMVISLLGMLAIGIVVSLDGVDDDARIKLTKTEMSELRKALLQFKRDVGHFPDGFLPNAAPLPAEEKLDLLIFCQPTEGIENYDPGCTPFNIDSARGWNGPYALPERITDPISNNEISGYFDAWGKPYHLFEPEDASPASGSARIVSFGPNGQYEGDNPDEDAICSRFNENSDDIVLCLVR